MKRIWSSVHSEKAFDFSLKQWNILAQGLSLNGGFALCPEKALHWDHRKPLIMDEILRDAPDLMCLEEVDCFDQISEHLEKFDYSGSFVPKPSSPCLNFSDNMGPDGSAIFYKKSKFSMIGEGFSVLTMENGSPSKSTVVWKHLKHLATEKKLLVMATHLKAKETPEFVEMRRQQAVSLNANIAKLIKDFGTTTIVLAGDFNASLDEPVYDLVRQGSGLESAYKEVGGKEPEYTTWKVREGGNEKKRTIDFIMFTREALEAREVLEVPEEEEIGKNRLPSLVYPSDHVSLMAKFNFIK